MKWSYGFGFLGLVLVAIGHGMGLFVAPKEAMMGDVGRILYVHVPTAWVASMTYRCICSGIGSLWTGQKWDASLEATRSWCSSQCIIDNTRFNWARPPWVYGGLGIPD